jgi:hypothetical protein
VTAVQAGIATFFADGNVDEMVGVLRTNYPQLQSK